MKHALKKTALCLLAALLLLASLASCSNKAQKPKDPLPFSDVYQSTVATSFEKIYTAKSEFQLPENASVYLTGDSCVFAYLAGENDLCFYNINSNKVVLTLSTEKIAQKADISLLNNYFKVVETDAESKKETTSIYTNHGTLIASAEGNVPATAYEEGVLFNTTFYRLKNDAVQKAYTVPPFTKLANNIFFLDDVIVAMDGDQAIFYNEKFEVTAFYEIPGTASDGDLYLLDNGKLLVQYVMPCDAMEKDYDLLGEGEKATLHHELFDPAKKKTEELHLNMYVTEVVNKTTMRNNESFQFDEVFTDAVTNVVGYYAIVDKRVEGSTDRAVLMDNDGKLGAALDQYVEYQNGVAYPLSNGYYAVATKTGYTVLKADGEVVCSTMELGTPTEYGYYSATDKKIYNQSFEPVVDLSTYGVLNRNDNAVFYTDAEPSLIAPTGDAKYYRYDKNGEAEITAPEGRVLYNEFYSYTNSGSFRTPIEAHLNYYVVAHRSAATQENPYPSDTQYSFYSMNGELLFTSSNNSFNVIAAGDDAVLINYYNAESEKYVYLRLTLA